MINELLALRYEVVTQLHEDPVFTLYQAKDRHSGKDYLVRALRSPFAEVREVRAALQSAFTELNSVQVSRVEHYLLFDEHEGVPYVLSEVPLGAHLSERIKRLAPYSVPVSVAMAVKLLESLAALHQSGLAHGQLTASQIMVSTDGQMSVLEPGLWRFYAADPRLAGAILPSLAPYLAPEIHQGGMPTPMSDVYAVGVVLFELMSGRAPFSSDTPASLAQKHLTAPVPSLTLLNPAIPSALDELVRKSLSKDPHERYPNARAMLSDLRVMQDALRFGKPLPWPIASKVPVGTAGDVPKPNIDPAPAPSTAAASPKPAPIKAPSPPNPTKRKVKEEVVVSDRLPLWLSMPAYLGVMALIVMVAGWVYYNLTRPRSLKVPDLVGVSVTDAQQQLKKMNLTLRVSREVFDEKRPQGTIISVSPRPGDEVRERSSVGAVVSAGSRLVVMPDLRGHNLNEARRMLEGQDLRLDEREPDTKATNEFEPGTVLSQIPEAKAKVERRSKVRVVVAGKRTTSGDRGFNAQYELKIGVPAEIAEAVWVRVDMTDNEGTRTVQPELKYEPGETVQFRAQGIGSEVIFEIFFDGVSVKRIVATPDRDGSVVLQ